ncbi:MAG: DUF3426 domain-containing protein [Gammaproteobacteria bacterium]|nr:DUF3426 domain-containing protein [Gammaproteobacteria bacterium]
MYTHCPNCDTHFEISQEHLDIANGQVRCGKCDHIFNALESLYDKNPELNEDSLELNSNPELEDNSTQDTETSPETEELNTSQAHSHYNISHSNDIKEKMERIAASLSAATAELKSARESTKFHKHSDEQQQNLTDEIITPEVTDTPDEIITPEVADTPDEIITPEVADTPDEIITPEIADTPDESSELEIIEPEDELDILDFSASEEQDESVQMPFTESTTRRFDSGDIDILNSLISDESQGKPETEHSNELDDITQTLSDHSDVLNDSLDDEFSDSMEKFDDLDNGDELLAELEQLENDFINSNKNTSLDDELSPVQNNESVESIELNSATDQTFNQATTETLTDLAQETPLNKESNEEVVPSFLTQSDSKSSSPTSMFSWLAGTILLLLVLGVQYLHVNSTQLSQDKNIRPLLETICPITNCSLPLIRTPRKIVTVSHDVRTHPTVNNALEIQLIFKNKASYTQSYPLLKVTFSNSRGEVVASRNFLPDEYLTGDIQAARGIKSNQRQEVNLKIIDPDPGALLSFQFNYL